MRDVVEASTVVALMMMELDVTSAAVGVRVAVHVVQWKPRLWNLLRCRDVFEVTCSSGPIFSFFFVFM